MAHSRPDNIENKGDAWRLSDAAGAFVVALITDPRTESLYGQWIATRAILDATLAPLADHPRLQEMMQSWRSKEWAAHELFVRQELKLNDWAPWIARVLTTAFECRRAGRDFGFSVTTPKALPLGRKPRNDGQEVARNSTWLYRTLVKNPPDQISVIAAEYVAAERAKSVHRGDAAHSVVRNGIDQARALLDIVDVRGLKFEDPRLADATT